MEFFLSVRIYDSLFSGRPYLGCTGHVASGVQAKEIFESLFELQFAAVLLFVSGWLLGLVWKMVDFFVFGE